MTSLSAKWCTRKTLQNFLHLHYFGAPWGPLRRSSPVWAVAYSKAPSVKLPNFVPLSDNLSTRYLLLTKFVDFGDGVTD